MTREQKYIVFFSQLSEESLGDLSFLFSANARFKDPFNDVVGVDKIKKVFQHMYATTEVPRFRVNHHAQNEDKLFLQWDFLFTKNNKEWSISGSSMVTFNEQDQAIEHIDYWDPAEQIYGKIPILRSLISLLRKTLAAK